jgi:hypothetical protein
MGRHQRSQVQEEIRLVLIALVEQLELSKAAVIPEEGQLTAVLEGRLQKGLRFVVELSQRRR